MTKKKLFVFLFFMIISLCFFIAYLYFKNTPIASWVFYGKNGETITGFYYPPTSDSTTGESFAEPEIPEKEGLVLTQWGKTCSVNLTASNKILYISYSDDGLIQASLKDEPSPYNTLFELYFYQPDDMHWLITRLSNNTYQGWIWDNLENQLIPVSYHADLTTIINGTSYQLLPGSKWLYYRWQNDKIVEERLLDDLPSKDDFIPEQDKQRLIQAKAQLQGQVDDMIEPLNLPFKLDLWKNIPCEQYEMPSEG